MQLQLRKLTQQQAPEFPPAALDLRPITPKQPKQESNLPIDANTSALKEAVVRPFREGVQGLIGAAKSVGQTAMGAGELLGVPGLVEAYGGPSVEKVKQLLRPQGQSQQIGNTIGRFAQYAAPALLTGGASIPAQMAVGGLGSASIAKGAGESPLVAGTIGAAVPMLGAAVNRAVPSLRKAAEERVASAIGPRGLQEQKELSRVLPEITKRKPFAWSSEGFKDQFEQQANTVADKLDEVIDAVDATGRMQNTNAVAHSLDEMVNALKSDGGSVTPEGQAIISGLKKVQSEIKNLGRIHAPRSILGTESEIGLPRIVDKKTVGATVARLRELKQSYGKIIEGTGKHFYRDVSEASRAASAKEGYHALQKGMFKAVPEAKELGQEYSRLATVRDILRKNELRGIAGQRPGIGTVAEAGATAGGIVTGSPRIIASAAVLKALLKFTQSTPFKLASANLRTALANAIESGNAELGTQIVAQITNEAR